MMKRLLLSLILLLAVSAGAQVVYGANPGAIAGDLSVNGALTTSVNSVQYINVSSTIAAAYAALPFNGGITQLSSDITISTPQMLTLIAGKSLKLDLAGHTITCTNTSGVCLQIMKPDSNPRYRLEIAGGSGTLTYTGASNNITGVGLSTAGNGISDVSIHDLTISGFSTTGSVGMHWFFAEEFSLYDCTFTQNQVAFEAEVNTNNTYVGRNWFHLNTTAAILTDIQNMTFTDNLVQSNSAARPFQIVGATVDVDNVKLVNNWFENNGDTTANSRAIYLNANARAIRRLKLAGNQIAPGTNTPNSSKYVEATGTGVIVFSVEQNSWGAGPGIQTGFVASQGTTCVNDLWPVCDVNISSAGNVNALTGVLGVGVSSPRGTAEVNAGSGAPPDALNVNLATGFNITDGANVGLSTGFSTKGTLRAWLQARNNVGANNIAYPISLQEKGGNVLIGQVADNGIDRLQVTGSVAIKRLKTSQGSALSSGDLFLTGFGSTASVGSILGTDGAFSVTAASAGTGQVSNPYLTLIFHDGTWSNSPICTTATGPGNDTRNAVWAISSVSATQVVVQLIDTPIAGSHWGVSIHCVGR